MPQNKKHTIEARKKIVSDLYLKGYNQYEIAEKIGVSRSQVKHDIKRIHEDWVKIRNSNFDQVKERELSKIDKLEHTYWQAWEKSVEDYKQKSVKASGSGKAKKPDKIERTEKDMLMYGDPRFMAGIERCIEMRCKILGINAPIKTENKVEGLMIMVQSEQQKKLIENAR